MNFDKSWFDEEIKTQRCLMKGISPSYSSPSGSKNFLYMTKNHKLHWPWIQMVPAPIHAPLKPQISGGDFGSYGPL